MLHDGKIGFALAAAACALIAGCASPRNEGGDAAGAANQPDCFNVRAVTGFSSVSRDTLRVSIGRTRAYDIRVTGTCQELDFSTRIALQARSGNNLCVGRGFGQGEVRTPQESCTIVDVMHSPPPAPPPATEGGQES